MILNILSCIEEHTLSLSNLFSNDLELDMRNLVIFSLTMDIKKCLTEYEKNHNLRIKSLDLIALFFASGLLIVIQKWVTDDLRVSKKELAYFINIIMETIIQSELFEEK